MNKRIRLFLSRFRYPKTLSRVRYRIHLWQLYRGEKNATIERRGSMVSVTNPPIELWIKNFNTVFGVGMMFKSTPSGQFISDESMRKIELIDSDKSKGFKNPFEEEQIKEMESLGRILTLSERRHKNLVKLMDQAERQKFGD